MAVILGEDGPFGDDVRRRVRDQIALLRAAHDGKLGTDSEDDADFTYLFDPEHVLIRTGEDTQAMVEYFRANQADFAGLGNPVATVVDGVGRYLLPARRADGTQNVPATLDLLDRELGPGTVRPDHYLHVVPVSGSCCPATEPEETGLRQPWPPRSHDCTAGQGVRVGVVDSGWHPDAADPLGPCPWLEGVTGDDEVNDPRDLRKYAGHGTFIAGVVRGVAPGAEVRVDGFLVGGGAVLESVMVEQLTEALDRGSAPQVINLSAGCRTRGDRELLSFEVFYESRFRTVEDRTVLVAAAGNDSSTDPFWPASFEWATGVGSLDRDGSVSSFSNYNDPQGDPRLASANVFALGRNVVNAFPDGRYVCKEAPNTGDVRRFSTGLARWSGTSFAAPIVAGLIAARMSATGSTAPDARDDVLRSAVTRSSTRHGSYPALLPPYP